MKRIFLLSVFSVLLFAAHAGVTTYTFTSVKWACKVGSEQCNGTTDGWICDKEASEYMTGRTDAEGRLYSQGVSVKTGTSGAGATSVISFTNVRQMTLNFCLNSSKGRGVFYYQVGDAPYDSLIINKPATSGSGVYLRDSVLQLAKPLSGKIRFWVKCTENAININSLSIRAEEGGSTPFNTVTYQLVTSTDQLQDSDQIIIGVHQNGVNYIMGYFDEAVSSNNIHAIRGTYSADRTTVAADENAIYTLRKTTLNNEDCYYIQDELRYEEAYLVASGGQTKNRLALWTQLTDPKTYGNYGYWDIQVAPDGEAVIKNLGNSLGKYLQYNAQNSPTLFGCYATQGAQTPVCIYRRTEAIGDKPAIVAPLVNFGTALLDGNKSVGGERTITVNANQLTQDITAKLLHGDIFSVNTGTIDRDGGPLTIRYHANFTGHYIDTLLLTSGEVQTQVPVMLTVVRPLSIAEAVKQPDYTLVYLNEVEVTKKFDMYIFIRDASGSMLIWDGGNGATGKRYGAGLKNGDILKGVRGRYSNYYGVPELAPTAQWNVQTGGTADPEVAVAQPDSADVCRFLRVYGSVKDGMLKSGIFAEPVPVVDAFSISGGITEDVSSTLNVIVMISHDVLQLWVVSQTIETGLEETNAETKYNSLRYNILGQPVKDDYRGITITPAGQKTLRP